jgi:ribosomal protein S27AE
VTEPEEQTGGDPVCWAHLLCPECGAVPDRPDDERCARCGADLPAADEQD